MCFDLFVYRNHAALFGLNFHASDKNEDYENESDEDSYDSADDLEFFLEEHSGPNTQRKPELQQKNQTADDFYKKFASKVNVDK